MKFASTMGVAAVATLILLSGCGSATPAKETDYAAKLEGTWNVEITRSVETVEVMTAVTASVSTTGTNKGTVALTITNTPPSPTAPPMIEVSGDIVVNATTIMVSNIMVDPADPALAAGLAQGVSLTYNLSDSGSELTVGNDVLFAALLGPTYMEVTLTKQMASS